MLGWSYIGTPLSTVSDDFNFTRVKLNSVLDPGVALGSTDAYGYLAYYNMYGSFVVLSSSIEVLVVNTDSDVPLRVSVIPTMDDPARSPSWTADSALINSPYAKSVILGNATGMDRNRIAMTCDVGKLAGVGTLSPKTYEYTGSTAANIGGVGDPPALGSWIIAAQAVSSATDNIDLVLSIRLSYRVRFYNYVVPLSSSPTLKKDEKIDAIIVEKTKKMVKSSK